MAYYLRWATRITSDMKQRANRLVIGLLALCAVLSAVAPARSQPGGAKNFGIGIIDRFDPAGDQNLVTISSQFTAATAERPAVLMISARIAPGWHIYAITQPPGGPQSTKIHLTPSPKYRQIGPFRAFPPAKSYIDQTVFKGLEIQEHEGE